jgi:hypothetical protein
MGFVSQPEILFKSHKFNISAEYLQNGSRSYKKSSKTSVSIKILAYD